MISHLNNQILKYTVGYGSLLTSIFQSFNIDTNQYGLVPNKAENVLCKSTLGTLNLHVVNVLMKFIKAPAKSEKEEQEVEEEPELE